MDLKDVSEWTIWIDDVEGELAMDPHQYGDDFTGRKIEVLAKEEIIPKIDELEKKLKLATDAALAFQKLATCYRTGKQPSEKLFKELVGANMFLDAR
jgi:hypothetical protein